MVDCWDVTVKMLRFKRYPDGCYAVVSGKMRGPCGHSKREAARRFVKSGLIAPINQGA